MLRILIYIFIIPFIYFYGKTFVFLFPAISLYDKYQLCFWGSFSGTIFLLLIFTNSNSFFRTFAHELIHNIWAVLTFNKPTGFHVYTRGGGLFEFEGRGNFIISLSPYFSLTFSLLLLPFYLLIKEIYHLYFFILLGLLTGFQTVLSFGDIKLILKYGRSKHLYRNKYPNDFEHFGYFFSFVIIILGNILTYGIIISFTIDRWFGLKNFFIDGINEIVKLYYLIFV